MDGLRRELLARAALADEERRRRSGRDAPDLIVEHLHALRAAEDLAETTELAQRIAQLADLVLERRSLLGVAEHSLHALEIRGFDQVVARAGAQRRDGTVDRRVTRDDDDFRRLGPFELARELDALSVGQAQVGEQ